MVTRADQQKKNIIQQEKKKEKDFKKSYTTILLYVCTYLLHLKRKEKSQCISQKVTQKRLMNSTKCPHKTPCSSEDIFAYKEAPLKKNFEKDKKKAKMAHAASICFIQKFCSWHMPTEKCSSMFTLEDSLPNLDSSFNPLIGKVRKKEKEIS